MNRAADVALAAFQEIGAHLAVVEGERLHVGRGLNEEKFFLEHDAIKFALEEANGSVVHAARTLGISFQALTYTCWKRDTKTYRRGAFRCVGAPA